MEQTIKTILIVLLLIAVAVLGSLLYIQGGLIHAQKQTIMELSSKIKSNEKQMNLDLQAKCADQSRKEFVSNGWDKRPLTTFSNHYNERLNKCFIEIEDDGVNGTSRVVSDAFEGKVYGNYMWFSKKGKKYWEVPPIMCKVTMPAGEEKLCNSSDEFDALLKPYME